MDAEIADNGAVLLGSCLTCDAHYKRPVRAVTHAHFDHTLGLSQSVAQCEYVIMTPQTKDIIEIVGGKRLINSPKINLLQYEIPFIYGAERITFYPAHHIIGSAQVLLEGATRIVYTGDFRLREAPIESDILVIEATYGNPHQRRRFKDEVKSALIDLIRKSLKSGAVYVFGYYGKLQEVLEVMHLANLGVPVVMPEKVFKLMKVSEKYGMNFGEYYEATKSNFEPPFIALYHMGAKRWVGRGATRGATSKIYLSGWEFEKPVRKETEREFTVSFSDHADFDELMEYVRLSHPKFVITDNKRVGDAETLASEIRKRFGIKAQPMP